MVHYLRGQEEDHTRNAGRRLCQDGRTHGPWLRLGRRRYFKPCDQGADHRAACADIGDRTCATPNATSSSPASLILKKKSSALPAIRREAQERASHTRSVRRSVQQSISADEFSSRRRSSILGILERRTAQPPQRRGTRTLGRLAHPSKHRLCCRRQPPAMRIRQKEPTTLY